MVLLSLPDLKELDASLKARSLLQGLAIFGDMPGMIATRLNLRLAQLGSVNITRTSKHVKNKIKKERSKNARQVDAVIANQVSFA